MFSQTVEYALRAAVVLAAGRVPLTADQIATASRVPKAYLAKLLSALARGGVVNSQRGVGGGFVLRRAAEELTVYDVIDAVEPTARIVKCPLDDVHHGACLCPLHRCLDEALARNERIFRGTTLAALVGPQDPGEFACSRLLVQATRLAEQRPAAGHLPAPIPWLPDAPAAGISHKEP